MRRIYRFDRGSSKGRTSVFGTEYRGSSPLPRTRVTTMASKEYHRKYNLKRYHLRRQEALQSLGGECVACGSIDNLQFDHVDPSRKSFDSKRWMNVSIARFWEEISKCQLLCRGCHEEKSLEERGEMSAKGSHGTLSSYRYCGPPKCDACKTAKREYMIEYRQKKTSLV